MIDRLATVPPCIIGRHVHTFFTSPTGRIAVECDGYLDKYLDVYQRIGAIHLYERLRDHLRLYLLVGVP